MGAVNRVPAENDIRSNMVRGGAARETDFTPREREICAKIGPELKKRGLIFVGIDVIDGNLTEINVTSPTGVRAIKRLGGPDLAVAIWDAIEARRAGA
jgi:glutathione synthase